VWAARSASAWRPAAIAARISSALRCRLGVDFDVVKVLDFAHAYLPPERVTGGPGGEQSDDLLSLPSLD
jgi:hypothetical protein